SDAIRQTDTTRFAHVLLPAAAWAEKDGTVTNSERRISRQRRFLPLPGEVKPDWWHLAEVGKRMGFAGFEFADAAAIFAEHAALSGFENEDTRDFDISAYAEISSTEFDALQPFLWPQRAGEKPGETRFFAEGKFYTPDRKARFLAVQPRSSGKAVSADFPLWLNTGRIRDQWHTMTRTGKTQRLMSHFTEPFCDIHPADAEASGIEVDDVVSVETAYGRGLFRANLTTAQRPGSIFVPMHWTDQFASRARINAATHPATDPTSGQPGLKACAAMIRPFAAEWYGFAISTDAPSTRECAYWALARAEGGYRLELAGDEPIADWHAFAARLLNAPAEAEWVAFYDRQAGLARLAAFVGDKLIGALFVGPEPVDIAKSFVTMALAEKIGGSTRLHLLAGRGGADRPDPGAIICACFAVGVNQIVTAIRDGGAISIDAVGEALKAGTNCGSCRSEIRRLLDEHVLEKAG
ncbi:MAG: molybdopterin dinucleotide binding domain-containing protein, partial [Rhabdaerophilum sp.]